MKKLFAILLISLGTLLSGCWIARTAHDRPELRREIGRTLHLTNPSILFRDRGGQLHLTDDRAKYYAPVITIEEQLPAGTPIEVKDVIYRITEAGRHDYFVIEVSGLSQKWQVEVNLTHKPEWK